MKLLIDDARLDLIKKIYEYYPVDGVTTNPSILAKTGRAPFAVLKEIRAFIGDNAELHVQAVSQTAEDMVAEGHRIAEILGKNTYIKIPAVPEGLKAIRQLKSEGYCVTATAIYTPMQAFLAAKAGANYAAPYVNRIDNLGADGVATVKTIQNIFENSGLDTSILAASFKNTQQVQALCEYGVGACTVSPEVIEGFLKNDSVRSALSAFSKDFENLCGNGKTMLNCE